MPLDPRIAEILSRIEKQNAPALNDLPVEDARALVVAGIPDLPDVPVGRVENRLINGTRYRYQSCIEDDDLIAIAPAENLPIRIYYPLPNPADPQREPAVHVYFHGGGWLLGNLETHDEICRELCAGAGIIVVSVDYRLAPEHPFPAGLSDAFAAFSWVSENLVEIGARQDPKAVSVGGDSAGANLAAAVCMLVKNSRALPIWHQLLLYPVTDASMSSESYKRNGKGYILSKDMMGWFWKNYCPEPSLNYHSLVSILHALDVVGLPSATILTAEYDPLCDEGEFYAKHLSKAGVAVEFKCLRGMIHGFMSQIGYIPAAREGLRLAVNALKKAHD